MRLPRLKCPGRPMAYHCISRLAGGVDFLSDCEKEHLVNLMWRVTDFCGLEVYNYNVLGNHYHMLLFVPEKQTADNWELLRRYERLHGKNAGQSRVIRRAFERGGGQARYWREKLLGWMGDISEHQRRLKEYFSKWYNRRHQRKGTLWGERFKSPVVELTPEVLGEVGCYIELNATRAGLVDDPADYRFCSYHAALAGDRRCLRGLQAVTGENSGNGALAKMRLLMGWEGVKDRGKGKCLLDASVCRKLLKNGGELPRAARIYWKNRYLVDSVVLGSREYVERMGRELGRWEESQQLKGFQKSLRGLLRLRRSVYGFE